MLLTLTGDNGPAKACAITGDTMFSLNWLPLERHSSLVQGLPSTGRDELS